MCLKILGDATMKAAERNPAQVKNAASDARHDAGATSLVVRHFASLT